MGSEKFDTTISSELKTIRKLLDHCPSGSIVPPDLIGWQTLAGTRVCVVCAGRLVMRGTTQPLRGAKAVYSGDKDARQFKCHACDPNSLPDL